MGPITNKVPTPQEVFEVRVEHWLGKCTEKLYCFAYRQKDPVWVDLEAHLDQRVIDEVVQMLQENGWKVVLESNGSQSGRHYVGRIECDTNQEEHQRLLISPDEDFADVVDHDDDRADDDDQDDGLFD